MAHATPSINEKLITALQGKEGTVFTRQEIIDLVLQTFPGTNATSVIPSDYCYNRSNEGVRFEEQPHLFEWQVRGQYKYLGEGIPYTGTVYWNDSEFGTWNNGVFERMR